MKSNYSILILQAYISQNEKLIEENKKRIISEFNHFNREKYEKLNIEFNKNIKCLQRSIQIINKHNENENN